MSHSELVQSLKRGLELLKLLSMVPEGMQLNELSSISGLKKPTVHNLMRTLCAGRFAVKVSSGCYQIGPAAIEIAGNKVRKDRLVKTQNLMRMLAERFPQSVITVSFLSSEDIRCLMRISPDTAGTVQFPFWRCFLPYVSASGILLQALNPGETAFLEEQYPFDEYGAGMWGSIENFSAAQKKIIADGYCCLLSKKSLKIAFPMPDLYVLGFNTPAEVGIALQEYCDAADEFRQLLQSSKESEK